VPFHRGHGLTITDGPRRSGYDMEVRLCQHSDHRKSSRGSFHYRMAVVTKSSRSVCLFGICVPRVSSSLCGKISDNPLEKHKEEGNSRFVVRSAEQNPRRRSEAEVEVEVRNPNTYDVLQHVTASPVTIECRVCHDSVLGRYGRCSVHARGTARPNGD
jgi:hypothetical protein